MPQEPVHKPVAYKSIDTKTSLARTIAQSFPKGLRPTAKTVWIAMVILLLVVCYGIVEAFAPLTDFTFDITKSEALELRINVGYPYAFFATDENATKINVNPYNAGLDLVIYFFIGYIIDVFLNYLLASIKATSKEEQEKKPQTYKFKRPSTAQKAADTILKNIEKKQHNNQTQTSLATPTTINTSQDDTQTINQ